MSKNKRVLIIEAAEAVVRKQGVGRLTLSEVAEKAGISKGGLLYHFPSKDALIKGMLDYAMDTFEEYIVQYQAKDKLPGSWMRGYIKGTFPSSGNVLRESASASALIASISHNPALLEHYRNLQAKWFEHTMQQDSMDVMTAQVIQMATDGLWLNEALGMTPLGQAQRKKFIDHLLKMTESS